MLLETLGQVMRENVNMARNLVLNEILWANIKSQPNCDAIKNGAQIIPVSQKNPLLTRCEYEVLGC